jgi:cephalosporin hydroxylase
LKELNAYAPMVTVNSYLVVQDTHLHGHPVEHVSAPGEGPAEAVAEFLKTTSDFVVDRSWERHLITQSPGGFLRRMQ